MSAPSRASIPSPMRRVSRARNSDRGSDFFEDDSAEAMFGDKLPTGKLKKAVVSCILLAACPLALAAHGHMANVVVSHLVAGPR